MAENNHIGETTDMGGDGESRFDPDATSGEHWEAIRDQWVDKLSGYPEFAGQNNGYMVLASIVNHHRGDKVNPVEYTTGNPPSAGDYQLGLDRIDGMVAVIRKKAKLAQVKPIDQDDPFAGGQPSEAASGQLFEVAGASHSTGGHGH
ncbi:MAG: hypothetical protein ABJA67_06760 [Chthonomonadales bacterium]